MILNSYVQRLKIDNAALKLNFPDVMAFLELFV